MGIKRTLSIGDIHGRNIWKNLTHGTVKDYESWRTAIDSGIDVNAKVFKSMPYRKFDKIIFVGDYVDSFTVDNLTMKLNLLEIIHLKKALGDKVVLLIGNHDISYIVPNQQCSGFRPEMKLDFYQIYNNNIGLFKAAHEEVDKHGRPWLWTHAGVTTGWISELRSVLRNSVTRHYQITKDWDLENVANLINNAWELRIPSLFNVDSESGGFNSWAGPFAPSEVEATTRQQELIRDLPVPSRRYAGAYSPGAYSPIGVLTRLSGSGDMILPLMGRQLANGRSRYQYYTMMTSGSANPPLPVSVNGKSCTSEYGCDTISNGDVVYVDGINDTFRATIYENDFFTYVPY